MDLLLALGAWGYSSGIWHHHIFWHVLATVLALSVLALTMAVVLAAVAAVFSRDRSPLRWFERIMGGVFSFCNIFKP